MASIARSWLAGRGLSFLLTTAVGLALASGCVVSMGKDDEEDDGSSRGGSSHSGGSSGVEQSGGNSGNDESGGSSGNDETGGTGNRASGGSGNSESGGSSGEEPTGGDAGAPEGGSAGEEPVAGAAGDESGGEAGADVGGGSGAGGCGSDYHQQAGTIERVCAEATDDECDASSDTNSDLPNGSFGNGFDDDCDGLVDEGCLCPSGTFAGESHDDCWLVPASQADPNDDDHRPVGWCREHAGGSRVCVPGESGGDPVWSGECRGAQAPRVEDVCSSSDTDFNCDGVSGNAPVDCDCVDVTVECPVDPIERQPFPDPNSLEVIDGSEWVLNGVASNWTWTVTGGDCDNILPHPSFAVYGEADTESAEPIGEERTGLGLSSAQTGIVVEDGASSIYPAFALSGDYLVKAEFEVDGVVNECTVKVEVRAEGIRAEACWTPMPNDLDLHVGRMQADSGSDPRGWFQTGGNGDDCYYAALNPDWGYEDSDGEVCHGWGSRRGTETGQPCPNPRLDRDNISCDASETNPANDTFCAAENTNIDNPSDGDRFAIALQYYSQHTSGSDPQPHINVYCNGERRLAMGFDPVSGQQYPQFLEYGSSSGGDFWTAAVVQWIADNGEGRADCNVVPVHSDTPKPSKDGSLDYCVDTDPQNGEGSGWNFISGGGFPNLGTNMTVNSVSALCYH